MTEAAPSSAQADPDAEFSAAFSLTGSAMCPASDGSPRTADGRRPDGAHSPVREAERLSAVRRYDVLDTPPDAAFERVTAVAARIFDVPIAIVSIVDTDRIWFKSHHGLDIDEVTRDPGLCASAILHGEPWVVTDASADPRTLANPLVAGALGLRFYAGVPLTTTDGHNVGTLCVIDTQPRSVSDKEMAALDDLAAIVVDALELRLAARKAIALEQQNRHQAEEHAAALQTSLLPPFLPTIPGADLAGVYRPAGPAEVGGDFYDVFAVNPWSWALVIGDVCGRGPAAASRSAVARYSLRGAAMLGDSPAATLERVNLAMLAGAGSGDAFCTMVFALVDRAPKGLRVRLSVAGHPLPTVLRRDGTVAPVAKPGTILGAFPDATFRDDEVLIMPGDTLVLVTDGLLEIRTAHGIAGPEDFERRLAGCAGLPTGTLVERLAGAIDDDHDDAAALALRAR